MFWFPSLVCACASVLFLLSLVIIFRRCVLSSVLCVKRKTTNNTIRVLPSIFVYRFSSLLLLLLSYLLFTSWNARQTFIVIGVFLHFLSLSRSSLAFCCCLMMFYVYQSVCVGCCLQERQKTFSFRIECKIKNEEMVNCSTTHTHTYRFAYLVGNRERERQQR